MLDEGPDKKGNLGGRQVRRAIAVASEDRREETMTKEGGEEQGRKEDRKEEEQDKHKP